TFGASSGFAQNYYDLAPEYGLSIIDTPHRIVLAPILRIPGPPRGSALRWMRGGWSAAAVAELRSGPPVSAYVTNPSPSNLGLFGPAVQRPNLTGASICTSGDDPSRIASADHPSATWLNPAAFANPGVGAFGNAPRTNGNCRYPFYRNLDAVFNKDFSFGSRTAQIRFEILNLTNTPHFAGTTSSDISNPAFGQIVTTRGFARIWQLSYRFRF